jgi:DNA replication protein DnaC
MKTFGNDFRYWKENNLLKGLRDSMENVQGDYLDVLKYMIDSEFLILDDVGSSVKLTEWREEILFETIDYRYNHLKPTMITSNFCSEDFKKIYHNRIYSRLFSIENTIIEIPHGVDFRLQNLSKLSNKIEKLQTER